MSWWLVGVVTLCYAITGIEQFIRGHFWFGTMWLCYSLANYALMKVGGTT